MSTVIEPRVDKDGNLLADTWQELKEESSKLPSSKQDIIVDQRSAVMLPAELQDMVVIETKNRSILTDYISKHMKEGVDYGKIGSFPKDCLFKPGSEKFLSLMKLKVRFHKDDETFEMAGKPSGLFCYKATLVNRYGEFVGEGRGACSIQEKKNTNIAIKIALKRAQMDAVLRTGGLSDFFTQDLEDLPEHVEIIEEPIIKVAKQVASNPSKSPTTYGTCARCGKGEMTLKEGFSKKTNKRYKFYGCSAYPNCTHTKNAN
jgi:ssDNA-binding Zn-finger/Zn-ribbon topoisomerase 1